MTVKVGPVRGLVLAIGALILCACDSGGQIEYTNTLRVPVRVYFDVAGQGGGDLSRVPAADSSRTGEYLLTAQTGNQGWIYGSSPRPATFRLLAFAVDGPLIYCRVYSEADLGRFKGHVDVIDSAGCEPPTEADAPRCEGCAGDAWITASNGTGELVRFFAEPEGWYDLAQPPSATNRNAGGGVVVAGNASKQQVWQYHPLVPGSIAVRLLAYDFNGTLLYCRRTSIDELQRTGWAVDITRNTSTCR